jgi:hypothetical protein
MKLGLVKGIFMIAECWNQNNVGGFISRIMEFVFVEMHNENTTPHMHVVADC